MRGHFVVATEGSMDLHWLGEKGHGHWWLDALQTHRWSGGGNREASPLDHMPSLPGLYQNADSPEGLLPPSP